jgi:nucleotide-binding universal stress UspA family protein
MRRILIATDGSPASQEAVEVGLTLAAEEDAQTIVVHVVPPLDYASVVPFGFSAALPHEPGDADRAPLEAAAEAARERGMEVVTRLLAGDPVAEIVTYADSIDADLTVVGSHGRGAIGAAVHGSVSRGVVRESRRPVFVARHRVPEPA